MGMHALQGLPLLAAAVLVLAMAAAVAAVVTLARRTDGPAVADA
jgi:hypothetical protein